MVRYKRRRRGYYRNSTKVIRMKFQSFMDISTSATSMQIITVSAGGPEILRRLGPQFGAYKYYKIGNIAVKLVPASTLPVDPTGLSYEAGENTIDPRDQLTPGMMRITNGEDIFENISGLSDSEQHAIYNNMLLDPRWYKWMLQSGVKRHATPRYWQIGQLHQDKWPGAITNIPYFDDSTHAIEGTSTALLSMTEGSVPGFAGDPGKSSPYGFFQVGHRGTLGWLPTDGLDHRWNGEAWADTPLIASPPEIEVMKIILPKAYKAVMETLFLRRELGIIIVCSLLRLSTLESLSLTSVLVLRQDMVIDLLTCFTCLICLIPISRPLRSVIMFLIVIQEVTMATIKVFSADGVKVLGCFDTLDNVEYFTDEEDVLIDDGELTVGNPIE